MNFDFAYVLEVIPAIMKYVPLTLFMSILAMVVAIVIGILLAVMKESQKALLRGFTSVYLSFFRSVPTLVLLFIIYYGLPQLFPLLTAMEAVTAAVIGLGIKQAAFLAEIFRAAIISVNKGQMEAGLSVGMSKLQTAYRIILPQAAENALPGTGNTFISLIKETSLAFSLGVTELFAEAKMMASSSYKFLESYLAVALVYWVLIIIYSYLQRILEEKLSKPYRT